MIHGPPLGLTPSVRVQWCGGVVVGGQGEGPRSDWTPNSLVCSRAGLYVTKSLIDGCLTPQGSEDLTV